MIVLSDNDIISKLARCDLLDALPHHLGISHAEIWVLSSSVYALRKRLTNAPEALASLEAFYARVTKIADADVDTSALLAISSTGIDAGEAILAAKAIALDGALLVTGDKRAIKALSTLPEGSVKASLAGKVLCFEALVLQMIEKYGFHEIGPRCTKGRDGDGVLAMAFGPGRNEAHAVECLSSYITSLKSNSGWILVA